MNNTEETLIGDVKPNENGTAGPLPEDEKKNVNWKHVAAGAAAGVAAGVGATAAFAASDTNDVEIVDVESNNDATPQHTGVVDFDNAATLVTDDMSFSQAFAAARAEVGAGGVFEWHGKLYNTYLASELNAPAAEVMNVESDVVAVESTIGGGDAGADIESNTDPTIMLAGDENEVNVINNTTNNIINNTTIIYQTTDIDNSVHSNVDQSSITMVDVDDYSNSGNVDIVDQEYDIDIDSDVTADDSALVSSYDLM